MSQKYLSWSMRERRLNLEEKKESSCISHVGKKLSFSQAFYTHSNTPKVISIEVGGKNSRSKASISLKIMINRHMHMK